MEFIAPAIGAVIILESSLTHCTAELKGDCVIPAAVLSFHNSVFGLEANACQKSFPALLIESHIT